MPRVERVWIANRIGGCSDAAQDATRNGIGAAERQSMSIGAIAAG